MDKSVEFWGIHVSTVITMEYEYLAKTVLEASKMSVEDVIRELTLRRMCSKSDDEVLACSRIISACLDGPDVIELILKRIEQ